MEASALPTAGTSRRRRDWLVPLLFLAPALIFLLVWLVYPTIRTIIRSFFGREGGDFVGFDNYKELFTTETLTTAIKNNVLWVAIVPAFVTAIGLVFAVLTERIRWSTAFKTVVFMPMAISLFAAGVIWRVMDQTDPQLGTVNASLKVVHDTFTSSGALTTAQASTPGLTGSPSKGFVLRAVVRPGGVALMGLTAIPPEEVPTNAPDAVRPVPRAGAIDGTVWRDFKPGGGRPGVVETQEAGLGGVSVELLRASGGGTVASATTAADGSFSFGDVSPGSYRVGIAASTFAEPYAGVNWLGPKLITPAVMIAYVWVWAGFAMVIIAAGLAAISREVLEAARTDGATEWQVFRRVTVPLLAPVLTVVLVTQIIGVLKLFDLILAIAPAPSRPDATTLAFEMWRRSFSGQNLFGLGSAIATFLFVLFIPFLVINIRRFRAEAR